MWFMRNSISVSSEGGKLPAQGTGQCSGTHGMGTTVDLCLKICYNAYIRAFSILIFLHLI